MVQLVVVGVVGEVFADGVGGGQGVCGGEGVSGEATGVSGLEALGCGVAVGVVCGPGASWFVVEVEVQVGDVVVAEGGGCG